jgi:AAA family ATP:ADP antiporter
MIPQASQLNPLDRFFGLFTKMRPGEGRSVFLFFWLGFIFMFGQWVLKPIRDVFILSEADAEMAAYGNAVQAVLLMLVIPLYGVLYRRLTKTRLVQAVTLFFIATLLLFYFLYEAGNSIYFPFYIWVGLYGTMLIAQFWALAADHYNVKSGQRLFGVFAAGVSLGALVGPLTVSTFVATLGTGNLLLLVAAALSVTLFLVNPSVNAIPEGSRSTGAKDDQKKKSSFLGGFATVLSDRYLTLIAFWVVLQNIIDSTGDYILKTWVKKHANELVASGESTLGVGEQIGVIFGNFYFVQNLVTFLLALLVVSRVLRIFGIQKAIRFVPVMMILGYAVIALTPVIAFLPIFSIIWIVKIMEKGSNYSLNNTIRGALFLPTSQSAKYEGKTTIDAFFWRFGDLLQAAIIFVAIHWLDFGITEIALFTMLLAAVMLWLAVLVGRHYSHLAATNVTNAPPEVGRPIPDAAIAAGDAFRHEIAPDTFTDPDPGEVLVLSATLADGAPLPSWVNFDSTRLLFSGTVPTNYAEEIMIVVTASDVDGASISDTFVFRHVVRTGLIDQ